MFNPADAGCKKSNSLPLVAPGAIFVLARWATIQYFFITTPQIINSRISQIGRFPNFPKAGKGHPPVESLSVRVHITEKLLGNPITIRFGMRLPNPFLPNSGNFIVL